MAQPGTLAPSPWFTALDSNGDPIPGAKLFAYQSGTTTKTATYTDAALSVAHTNPIIMDAAGRAVIYLSPTPVYKFVLAPADDTDPPTSPIKTVDPVTAVPLSSEFILGNTPRYFSGVHLRTHPNALVALHQVMLVRAEEIVMNDGELVRDWDNLVADITQIGAGGLDTGVEAASQWYEIWAIRKSSDGTKNLLLNTAVTYTLNQSQATSDATIALRDAAARTKVAQGFKASVQNIPACVDITIAKVGVPTGRIWLSLQADVAGNPSGTALITSDKLDVAKLTTTAQAVRFVFRGFTENSPILLATPTQYHIVVEGDFTISAANYVNITEKAGASSYAGGDRAVFDGVSTWTHTATSDLKFGYYIFFNTALFAETMPSGYDQKALIGYVYNNSASDFVRFIALDRYVTPLISQTVLSGATVTTPTLTDLSAFIPPGPVKFYPWVYGDGGAVSSLCLPVPDGFSSDSIARSQGGSRLFGTAVLLAIQPVITETQAVYFFQSAGTMTAGIDSYEWGVWLWSYPF